MTTLFLYQVTDCETHCVFTLYRLTSLHESPTKVAQDGGFSVWPDDRISIEDWANQKVYELIGDEVANDNVFIHELR